MNVMNFSKPLLSPTRLHALTLAIALATGTMPAFAQQMDHSQHAPPTTTAPATDDPHAGHVMPVDKPKADEDAPAEMPDIDHAAMGHAMPIAPHESVDHMAHDMPMAEQPESTAGSRPATGQVIDHAAMGHEMPLSEPAAQPMDHSGMDHSTMDHSSMGQGEMDHAAMGHTMGSDLPANAAPREPIPTVTAADRAAAFGDVAAHTVHDDGIHWFALADRLETWDADEGNAFAWETIGWIGTDLDRLWIRSEGESVDGSTESANLELFYGRAIARWWDGVVGIRHDFGEGPSQTFAGIGVIGMSPYKFEVEATAYIGEGGQTAASVEVEYDTLLTNRLILQWLVEAEAFGKDDPRRGIASGFSKVEAGLRLRYEFTRRFAPYIGVVHERAFGGTADLRRDEGQGIDDTRVVAGVRVWF